MPAHARSDEHRRLLELLGERGELAHPIGGIIQTAIVHRLHPHPQVADHRRHGRDLRTPGTAFLAVRKHHRTEGSGHKAPKAKEIRTQPLTDGWHWMKSNRAPGRRCIAPSTACATVPTSPTWMPRLSKRWRPVPSIFRCRPAARCSNRDPRRTEYIWSPAAG